MRIFGLGWMLVCLLGLNAFSQDVRIRPFDFLEPLHATETAKISNHDDYPMLCTQFSWLDSLSAWDTLSQLTYAYYLDGNTSEVMGSTYNGASFDPDYRSIYSYNAQGLEQEEYSFNWNGGSWDTIEHHTNDYDVFGNPTAYWRFIWNGAAWDTLYGMSIALTYRNVDQIQTKVTSNWSTLAGWMPQDSVHFGFDGSNRWDTVTQYLYSGGNWNEHRRTVNFTWYDFSKELPLTATYQAYSNGWVDDQRLRASYSQYDSERLVYDNYNAPNWDSAFKFVNLYDAHGHRTSYEYYDWIGAWQMEDGELDTYTYDGNGRTQAIVYETFDGYLYRYTRKDVFDNFFTGAPAPSALAIETQIFPNPASDRVHFRLALSKPSPVSIALYDLAGRLRATTSAQRVDAEIVFPISETLENGTYIYQITTKEGVAKGKVCIQR